MLLRIASIAAVVVTGASISSSEYVSLTTINGTWWFQHNGATFLSFAMNHVNDGGQDDGVGGRERAVCREATNNSLCGDSLNFGGALGYAPYFNVTQDKYAANETAWAETSIARLRAVGFNGISGWSARIAETAAARAGAYYFHLLDIGVTWPFAWSKGLDWDVWSSNFSDQCEHIAATEVPPRAQDPFLIAWQTDNEINWGVLGLDTYLTTYGAGPGGAAALTWLQSRYNGSISALDAAWNVAAPSWATLQDHLHDKGMNETAFGADDADFQGLVAGRYAQVTTTAIRSYDPNHLVSGVRFAVSSPQIIAAVSPYFDIIDQHDYGDLPNMAWLAQAHNISGKPILLGEFSFTAADSNLPNTHGARAGNPCTTQTGRANMFAAYASQLLVAAYVIGLGWWNFVDEPATGRWPDGENSNYGLFTLADDTYSILASEMSAVFSAGPSWHASGVAPCLSPGSNYSTVALVQYYSATRDDHYGTASGCYECEDLYDTLGPLASVYAQCVPGAVALSTYYSEAFQDNALLLGTPESLPGYVFVRVEGYALPTAAAALAAGRVPQEAITADTLVSTLKVAPDASHADYWAVLGPEGLANATAAGYAPQGLLGTAAT